MELQNCMTDMLSTLASGFGDKALMLVDKDGTPAGHILGTEMVGAMEYEKSKRPSMLPEGYEQLEYIESSGTQWIDTGIVPSFNTEVSMRAAVLGWVSSSSSFAGTRTRASNDGRYIILGRSGANYRTAMGSSEANFGMPHPFGTVFYMIFNETATHNVYMDNTLITTWTTGNVVTTQNTIAILAINGYGDDHYPSTGRIYNVRIKESGALVMLLIPAKRNSDNEVGMYDLVSNTFLTNAGTGTFSYGEL